jgi:hypothetical protein
VESASLPVPSKRGKGSSTPSSHRRLARRAIGSGTFARPSIGGPGGDVLIHLGQQVGRDALAVLTGILVTKLAGKVVRGERRDTPRIAEILGPD